MSEKKQKKLSPKQQQLNAAAQQIADDYYSSGSTGYDYYKSGGQNELESVIKRLREQDTEGILNDATFVRLRQLAPPDFTQKKTAAEVKSMWIWTKKSYNKSLEAYANLRSDWDRDHGGEWLDEIRRIEDMIEDSKTQAEKRARSEGRRQYAQARRSEGEQKLKKYQHLFPRLNATPDDMDRAFENNATKPLREAESAMAYSDHAVLGTGIPHATLYTKSYPCKQMKDYLHQGRPEGQFDSIYATAADELEESLSYCSINRDVVTRRGVAGVRCLAPMLGMKDPKSCTPDQIRTTLEQKMAQGDLFISDNAFLSTSTEISHTNDYRAGQDPDDPEGGPGIEFIILIRKGTQAADIRHISSYSNESEILINSNTKFRVVSAHFNLDSDTEEDKKKHRKLFHGDKSAWKIYLETIPQDSEGEEK